MSEKYNRVRGDVDSYDLLHPQEKQGHYQFFFRDDAPKELHRSFVIGAENFAEHDDPIEAAYEIKEYAEKCLFNDDKNTIIPVIAYLEEKVDEDYRDRLIVKAEKLRTDLSEVEKKLAKIGVQI